jgi:hypothetical protein
VKKALPPDPNKEAFAIVGELVMISAALDDLLNRVFISALHLGDAPLVEPVIATLDPARKTEILKARAAQIRGARNATDWKKHLKQFCDKVESVYRQRNIACHTPAVLHEGVWSFRPSAAAKLLKNLDIDAKTLRNSSLNDLKIAIATAETALAEGNTLIENFQRTNAELNRRSAMK